MGTQVTITNYSVTGSSDASTDEEKGSGIAFVCIDSLTLKDSTFESLYSPFYGAAILLSSRLVENTSAQTEGWAYWDLMNEDEVYSATISNITVSSCTALLDGGGMYVRENEDSSSPYRVSIADSTFTSNTAYEYGGHIHFEIVSAEETEEESERRAAHKNARKNEGETHTITNTTFTSGTCGNNTVTSRSAYHSSNNTPRPSTHQVNISPLLSRIASSPRFSPAQRSHLLKPTQFVESNNKWESSCGGGLSVVGGWSSSYDVLITGCTFTKSSGAALMADSGASVMVESTSFTENKQPGLDADAACSSAKLHIAKNSTGESDDDEIILLCDTECRQSISSDTDYYTCHNLGITSTVTTDDTTIDGSTYPYLPSMTFHSDDIIPSAPRMAVTLSTTAPSSVDLLLSRHNRNNHNRLRLNDATYVYANMSTETDETDSTKYQLVSPDGLDVSELDATLPATLYVFLSLDAGYSWTSEGVSIEVTQSSSASTSQQSQSTTSTSQQSTSSSSQQSQQSDTSTQSSDDDDDSHTTAIVITIVVVVVVVILIVVGVLLFCYFRRHRHSYSESQKAEETEAFANREKASLPDYSTM